jgi:hypothetical protein
MCFRRNDLRFLAISSIVTFWPVLAHSQQYTTSEFTVGLQAQTWDERYVDNNNHFAYHHYLQIPNPSFTYTRNLSSTLAIEGTVEPLTQFFSTNYQESGHGTLAMGGIKAGWRGKEWGLFGKTQAGIASWSCGTWIDVPKPYSDCSRITNFVVEYGGVIERQLFSSYALRFDAAHQMSTEFDQVLARGQNSVSARAGDTIQHLVIRIGLTKSFGSIHDLSDERVAARSAWDVGASFFLQPKTEPNPPFLNVYPSFGAWTSWNLASHLSWDTSVIHSGAGRNDGLVFSDYQAGGRSLEALTGLKIGLRRDRMGYFAKLRGGTITFGETERQVGLLPDGGYFIVRGMFTSPVLDVGGVWEVYPSHHTILRFDAGSATIFYQPKSVWQYLPSGNGEVGTKYAIPENTQTGLLLGFGAGIRF